MNRFKATLALAALYPISMAFGLMARVCEIRDDDPLYGNSNQNSGLMK